MADDTEAGTVPATPATIIEYLMDLRGGGLSRDHALVLMQKHEALVRRAVDLGSFAYYVGDEILRAEGLPEGGDE